MEGITPEAHSKDLLEVWIQEKVDSGTCIVIETVGKNGLVRTLAPTFSLAEYARQAGPLSNDTEPSEDSQ